MDWMVSNPEPVLWLALQLPDWMRFRGAQPYCTLSCDTAPLLAELEEPWDILPVVRSAAAKALVGKSAMARDIVSKSGPRSPRATKAMGLPPI